MFFRSKNKIPRRTLETEEKGEKKTRFSRVLFYILVLLFLAVSIYVILFSFFLQIKKIRVQGLEELDYEKVMQQIQSELDAKYFKVVAKNNLLLVRSDKMARELTGSFKKIRSANVLKIFPDTLVVFISERKALLVWCSGEDCFMVDEKGFAYALADFNSPEVAENHLIMVRDQSQNPVLFERKVLNPETISFLIAIRKGMKDRLDIELNREFETPQSISGDITATTQEGWRMVLNEKLGADREVEMLQLVLDQNIGKNKRGDLEYVDLRNDGKVFYKFKSPPLEKGPAYRTGRD